jgi:hypothetical protein
MSIFLTPEDKKTKILKEDFSSGSIPSYITNAGGNNNLGVTVVSSFPNNKLTATTQNRDVGRYIGESSFIINPLDYSKVKLTIKDIAFLENTMVTNYFGFRVSFTEHILFRFQDDGTVPGKQTVDAQILKNGFTSIIKPILKNINFLDPHDVILEWDIDKGYVDFMIEGTRVRVLDEGNFVSQPFKVVFYDMYSRNKIENRSVTFTSYKLELVKK